MTNSSSKPVTLLRLGYAAIHQRPQGEVYLLESEVMAEIERLRAEAERVERLRNADDWPMCPADERRMEQAAETIERLRAGLRRIGSVSASFKPVADRLLAGESIDAIADSPAETLPDAKLLRQHVIQLWIALDDLYALVRKQDMDDEFRARIEDAILIAQWVPRGAQNERVKI